MVELADFRNYLKTSLCMQPAVAGVFKALTGASPAALSLVYLACLLLAGQKRTSPDVFGQNDWTGLFINMGSDVYGIF